MALEISQMVDNRYRIVQLLGQGGMGAVYKAWDTRLNRPIALKEMIPQPGLDEEMLDQLRQQFENEAQVLGTLSHPNLVRVTDYFSWDGNEYLVMDFVDGESMAHRIERWGGQSEGDVLHWGGQLLDALSYCHGRGVLHRDIKPQNIIITGDGDAVLVDFGLVKLWDPSAPETRTVMRGAGTPEYAPPEQYDIGAGHTDPRSDVYSLGATLYHALTGKIPPTATQRMANPASFVPPRQIKTTLSSQVETAVLKAMEVSMSRRFQSAGEMAEALGVGLRERRTAPRAVTPQGTVVLPQSRETARPPSEPMRPPPPPAPKYRPPRKRTLGFWLLAAAGAVLCLALSGGCIVLFLLPTPEPTTSVVTDWTTMTPSSVPPSPTATTGPPTTPTPTATPDVSALPGQVLYQDDFTDSDSGWSVRDFEDGRAGYGNGYYFVVATQEALMAWGVAGQYFADVVIDVDTTQFSAPTNDNNGYGVMCRVQSNNDGYLLRISGDGFYSIQRVLDGSFEPLVNWTASSVIRQGNDSNHVRAICDGPELRLIVNDVELASFTDTTFAAGDIGLAATTYETEPSEVHFRNLVVTAPGVETSPVTVLYRDDFGDPDSGWDDWTTAGGSAAGYVDGVYRIFAAQSSWMWGRVEQNLSDVVIEIESTQIQGPVSGRNGYGVICRTQPNEWADGYAFVIRGNGGYSIQRISQGQWTPLVAWSDSDAINQGNAFNRLRVVCDGSQLMLYVNDELLGQTTDSTYTSGGVGLVASTLGDIPAEIHFDNLVVTLPVQD